MKKKTLFAWLLLCLAATPVIADDFEQEYDENTEEVSEFLIAPEFLRLSSFNSNKYESKIMIEDNLFLPSVSFAHTSIVYEEGNPVLHIPGPQAQPVLINGGPQSEGVACSLSFTKTIRYDDFMAMGTEIPVKSYSRNWAELKFGKNKYNLSKIICRTKDFQNIESITVADLMASFGGKLNLYIKEKK